ncbi:MAG: deoxynucleoside kinase [Anaerolineales bacterium]
MGKIISVVGNLGAGKTTLTQLLCDQGSFKPYWEKPEERPFHLDLARDTTRWALANQLDFFLFRCNQESTARQNDHIAVFDGGFDQDFHVFTRHLSNKGYLIQDEFNVCERFYRFARNFLPPPDIYIRIVVDIPTLLQRRLSRGRKTDKPLSSKKELTDFEMLLDEWLKCELSSPILSFTFRQDFHLCKDEIIVLIERIKKILSTDTIHTR